MHQNDSQFWDRDDLLRRVLLALRIAENTVKAAIRYEALSASDDGVGADFSALTIKPLIVSKVVAEATMLMRCSDFLGARDVEIACALEKLAHLLTPLARRESLLVSLCREPARALDHTTAHILLKDLGYVDEQFDKMLEEVLQNHNSGGMERLPNHELEHQWLRGIWSKNLSNGKTEANLLARTCIAAPLDALGSEISELYAFTHVLLYASDMGRQQTLNWPRSMREIMSDAETAVAASIDAGNYDLTAEILWAWPMLGVQWSPLATFCFGILAKTQDSHGFLPGPEYNVNDWATLPEELRCEYELRTSYHATFVMGFLCAAALRSELLPPVDITPEPVKVSALDLIMPLLRKHGANAVWESHIKNMDELRIESLAEFLLTIILRRARAADDLNLTKECLRIGLELGFSDGPAYRQSFGLLRRVTMLAEIMGSDAKQSFRTWVK